MLWWAAAAIIAVLVTSQLPVIFKCASVQLTTSGEPVVATVQPDASEITPQESQESPAADVPNARRAWRDQLSPGAKKGLVLCQKFEQQQQSKWGSDVGSVGAKSVAQCASYSSGSRSCSPVSNSSFMMAIAEIDEDCDVVIGDAQDEAQQQREMARMLISSRPIVIDDDEVDWE
jgi:hypothetical protein